MTKSEFVSILISYSEINKVSFCIKTFCQKALVKSIDIEPVLRAYICTVLSKQNTLHLIKMF